MKRLKIFNEIYDFFQLGKLNYQAYLYRKFGLNKKYFNSLSSKDFQHMACTEAPWLDKNDSYYVLPRNFEYLRLDDRIKSGFLNWSNLGYAVIKDFCPDDDIEQANERIIEILKENKVIEKDKGRFTFHLNIDEGAIDKLVNTASLRKILGIILGAPVEPSKYAVVLQGSEDTPHADFYHLSTFPFGYQITVLFVLEDFDERDSPIYCYPGSHKLPYVTNEDFDHGGGSWFLGKEIKKKYSGKIKKLIEEQGLEKLILSGVKGDIFIWHANMLHGGRKTPQFSIPGKALVLHYFSSGVLRYHEITQRPYSRSL